MLSQIFFRYGGARLSSVKFLCAGDGIVAAAAGDGSVADDVAGDGSAFGCTGVYGGLGTGTYGALRL